MGNVIPALSADLKLKIAGVVLFGSTRNKQDGGKIPNFPGDKVRAFCNSNDGVCSGGLSVTAGHLAYSNQIGTAATFLANQAKSAGGAAGRRM